MKRSDGIYRKTSSFWEAASHKTPTRLAWEGAFPALSQEFSKPDAGGGLACVKAPKLTCAGTSGNKNC